MKWADRFPDPGPRPPTPSAADAAAHFNEVEMYNAWVRKQRSYNIARAVDTLTELEASGKALAPVEVIALTVGCMLLDGTIPDRPTDVFSALMGL